MAPAVPLGRIEPPVALVQSCFGGWLSTMLSEQIAEAATTCATRSLPSLTSRNDIYFVRLQSKSLGQSCFLSVWPSGTCDKTQRGRDT